MEDLINIQKLVEKYYRLCWKLSGHYLSYDIRNNTGIEGEKDHIEINVKATRLPDSEDNFRSRKIKHDEILKTSGLPSDYESPDHLILTEFMELAGSMRDTQNYEFLLYATSNIYDLAVYEQVVKYLAGKNLGDLEYNIEVKYNQLEERTVQLYYNDTPYVEISFEEYVWSIVFLNGKSFPNRDAEYKYEDNMENTLIFVIGKLEEYG